MAQKKPINWQNVTTVFSVAILVGTELIGMTWAAAWALGGIFDLPGIFRTGIEVVGVLLGAYGLYHFVRAALKVEPLRG
ncbi:MAG: hypothetical protein K2Y29_05465 [Beijerinckiaceae bacterium]|nr:hypothetical protein [Beijerinckiaceae bacterium]